MFSFHPRYRIHVLERVLRAALGDNERLAEIIQTGYRDRRPQWKWAIRRELGVTPAKAEPELIHQGGGNCRSVSERQRLRLRCDRRAKSRQIRQNKRQPRTDLLYRVLAVFNRYRILAAAQQLIHSQCPKVCIQAVGGRPGYG